MDTTAEIGRRLTYSESPTVGLTEPLVETANKTLPRSLRNLTIPQPVRSEQLAKENPDILFKRTVVDRAERAIAANDLNTIRKEIQKLRRENEPVSGGMPSLHVSDEIGNLVRQSKEILQTAKSRDKLSGEYLTNQHNVSVTFPEYGRQTAQFVHLEPPEEVRMTKPEEYNKPPIVMLGGWGADVDSDESIVKALALSGRRVVFLAYPDSLYGSMTEKFADGVAKSKSAELHSKFFKTAIGAIRNSLVEQKIWKVDEGSVPEKLELWGMSMGAMIGAEMLTDSQFGQQVAEAVFYGPAGSVDFGSKHNLFGKDVDTSILRQAAPYISEILTLIKKWKTGAPRYSYVWNTKPQFSENKPESEVTAGEIWKKVWLPMLGLTSHEQPYYDDARVSEGGKILIVCGGQDQATRCSERFAERDQSNPQITVLRKAEWAHNDLVVNPDEVIPEIFKFQKGNPN